MIKKLYKSPAEPSFMRVMNFYTYDGKGRLVTDSIGYLYGTSEMYGYTNFTYDANDNVVEIQKFNRSSGSMSRVEKITASYYTDTNPYNTIGSTLYFLTQWEKMLSKHNIAQVIYERSNYPVDTETYSYEYDNGLLTKMVLSRSSGGPFGITTIQFYYN